VATFNQRQISAVVMSKGIDFACLREQCWLKGPQLRSKTTTQAQKKDVGVTVVVRHDTVPEQTDIKMFDRPKTQRGRYNVRDVPSGSWPVLIDRGIKAESCTN
jgi:hypothetical protein